MSQQGLSLLQCIWPSWLWQYEGHDGNHYKSKDNSLSWRSRSNLLLKDSSSSPNNARAAPLVDFHNGSTPTLPSSPVPTYLVWLEWRYIPPHPSTSSGVLAPPPPLNGSQGLPVAGIVEKNVSDVFPFIQFSNQAGIFQFPPHSNLVTSSTNVL